MLKLGRIGKRPRWALAVLGVAALVAPASLEAGGRRLRSSPRIYSRNTELDARAAEPELGRPRNNPYEYYRGVYPKFYGGFHAHEFQNLGVPSGDVGLRGNGLYLPPW